MVVYDYNNNNNNSKSPVNSSLIPCRMEGQRTSSCSSGRSRSKRINTYWITLYGFLIFSTNTVLASWGQSDFDVRLVAKKYVEKGSTLMLRCDNNVQREILYKVTWLKNGNKIFEYINGRNPPYRNFTIPGAVIDWKRSNEHQVTLRETDYEAAGEYSCEVSTDTPIFTKESNVEYVHVILPQTGPPRIQFSKRQFYIGENLVANCTTSRARPQPHITWLINGKKVDEKHIRVYAAAGGGGAVGAGGKASHRPKLQSHAGNNPQSVDKSSPPSPGGGPDLDIVDARFPTSRSFSENYREGNGGAFKELQQRLNSRMEKIENYPHYRSMAFADDDDDETDEGSNNQHDGDYQRVVFDEDGLVHSKHMKYKHRLRSTNKNRRHLNEGVRNVPKLFMATSQLMVEVSELHADMNGRLEITCLATIPAHVGPGEQFADYKTYSVKIDVEQSEVTTAVPQPAKLGNNLSSSSSSTSNGRALTLVSSCKLWQQHLMQLAFLLFMLVLKWH